MLSTTPAWLAGGIATADEVNVNAYYSDGTIDESVVGAADLEEGIVYDDVTYDDLSDESPTADVSPMADEPESLEPVAYVGDTVYAPTVESTPAPTRSVSHATPVMAASYGSGAADCGCGTTSCSTTSCGCPSSTMTCKPRKSMECLTQMWMTSEALLWFPRARSAPALITGNSAAGLNNGGQLPNFDETGTVSLFGGTDAVYATSDAIDGGLSGGFRFDGGIYLGEGVGVGGRFWWLSDNEVDYSASTIDFADSLTAIPSIGRPFFDTQNNTTSSVPVAFDNDFTTVDEAGIPSFTGTISAASSLAMYGAEAYARVAMLSGSGFRADLIGGYSHFGIEDELSMTSLSIQTNNDGANLPGASTVYSDRLNADNTFHGGQVGMETVLQRGGWTIRSLAKVHLGNMEQVITGVGQTTFTDAGGAATT
ncbi:MAG: BBP7 family outer membrane beta-barrel protein, partial [Planctomycetota bacterium]